MGQRMEIVYGYDKKGTLFWNQTMIKCPYIGIEYQKFYFV